MANNGKPVCSTQISPKCLTPALNQLRSEVLLSKGKKKSPLVIQTPKIQDKRRTLSYLIPTNHTVFISCLRPLAVLAVIGSEVVGEGEEHAGHPGAAVDAHSHCPYPRAGNGVRGKRVAGAHFDGGGVAVHVSYQFVAVLALHTSGLFVLAGEYIASFAGQQASLVEILGAS